MPMRTGAPLVQIASRLLPNLLSRCIRHSLAFDIVVAMPHSA